MLTPSVGRWTVRCSQLGMTTCACFSSSSTRILFVSYPQSAKTPLPSTSIFYRIPQPVAQSFTLPMVLTISTGCRVRPRPRGPWRLSLRAIFRSLGIAASFCSFGIRFSGQYFEHPVEQARLLPAAESRIYGLPRSIIFGELPPWCFRADHPKHRIQYLRLSFAGRPPCALHSGGKRSLSFSHWSSRSSNRLLI